jgi:hypothetical protein
MEEIVAIEERMKKIQELSENIDTTIGQVFLILKDFPQARDNDGLLICYWLQMFKGVGSFQGMFSMAREHKLCFETVRRARQKIQRSGQYLPSEQRIIKRRKLQEVWRIVNMRKDDLLENAK